MSGKCQQSTDNLVINSNGFKADPVKLLNVVLSMLPLHAEEGRQRESLLEVDLVSALIVQGSTTEETALSLSYTLRRQFEALSLLDPLELRGGKWAFISFPASLLGRSWLATLATPSQVLLPTDYWEQGDGRPPEVKEEQRSLLHQIEVGRLKFNPHAETIRTVHVAWAFIRLGNNFLMHHREDKKRPGEKLYVLPGGRFNLTDLPVEVQERHNILKAIFDPESETVAQHIARTLERELEEEAGLQRDIHYTYTPLPPSLPIYREVNGAGNRHAYTSYRFNLFQIKLTPTGETHLLDRVSTSADKLTWFSAADIAAPQRADGATAYVDALRQAWGDGLEKRLLNVLDSSFSPLPYNDESCMLDLPGYPGKSFYSGKPGKEKPIALISTLDQQEWQLLMLMSWHARGFPIEKANGIKLLANGWIKVIEIIRLTKGLQEKIQPVMPNLIEIREDRYASLRISPDILFLPAELFFYKIAGSNKLGGELRLERQKIQTPWGCLQAGHYEKNVTGKTMTTLRELEKGEDPDGDWERNLREQFSEGVRGIGLRRLWSSKGNISCLVDGLRRISES
ncbi:hypothetical protein AT959_15095 [Dechloromonas denitrificans]|uniref:Nudix hydrolase domain-containing protein n=1 Tax=Dechloromonas denitrificans TaxID=281362 RepID=A0A133XEC9_9RHOO|nr:hypothetical protein [Dechloromonas denitrificans]KXB29297.1 hypothetical protein AT959_15095 [Dechloromonas denitrificans]